MSAIQALVVLLIIFAFGELIADKTKAVLSTTLVVAVVLLVGFWVGLPADIIDTSGITGAAGVLIGILITSLGTLIDIPELKRQWKTVIIGFCCVVLGTGAIIVIGSLIIDPNMAIAVSPIFAGANVATLVMNEALAEKGLVEISSFVILMLVTQNFVGIPTASIMLRKEAKNFLKNPENIKMYAMTADEKTVAEGGTIKRRPLQLPDSFNKPTVVLAKLAIIAMVSQMLAGLTNGIVHQFVFCLLLGILFTELGFLDKGALNKSASSAFILFSTTIIIFANFAQTTPQMLISLLGPLVLCLALGCLGVFIGGTVLGKILKISPLLAIPLGLTCTFGFPTTLFISEEVSRNIGTTDEEKAALKNYILPKMVTAGFVTVTIVSVLVAGFVANNVL